METASQQAERKAAEWISRRDGGAWTEQDQAALVQWMDESASNTVAFLRLDAAWCKADRFKVLGAGVPHGTVPPPGRFNFSPFFSDAAPAAVKSSAVPARGRWALLAASVLLAVTAGMVMYAWPGGTSYSTPVGGLVSIPLEDGSKVTLNTDSKIRVVLTEGKRQVKLERGEAFFEVARNVDRPFVVETGDRSVLVVGTQFSVRQAGSAVQVLVTEGRVKLEDQILSAGASAWADERGTRVESLPIAELVDALSWRLGYVVLRDLDLGHAVEEFNRYNLRKLVIGDRGIASIRLEGKFKATNVDAFVRLLEDAFPVRADDRGRQIVLKRR